MEGLKMSRGAASMACRELRDWGLISLEKESGARQVFYRPETDLEKGDAQHRAGPQAPRVGPHLPERLREWIPELESERSAEAQVFLDRLRAIESLVGMVDSMAESFLKGGVLHSLGLKVSRRQGPEHFGQDCKEKGARDESTAFRRFRVLSGPTWLNVLKPRVIRCCVLDANRRTSTGLRRVSSAA